MAIVEINWSEFLKPNSELPTDVVFKVEERSEEDLGEVWHGKVVAHKLLLAGVSPVFRRQFFGALKEETEEQCPAGRVFQYRVGSGIGQNTG